MNRLARTLGLCLALLASGATVAHAQDFDPRGRKKPGGAKPGGIKKPGGVKKPGGAKPGGTQPKPGGTEPNAGEPGKNPKEGNDTELIERYTKIVLAQPGAPFPLQRLAGLYRHRDGSVDKALADFETRAKTSGAEQYAATVGLAGLFKAEGRSDDAVKSYEAAITLKPGDAAAYLALAALHQDRADLPQARKRYEEGLARQTAAGDKEQTLRTLLAVALDQKDFAAAKAFHEKLVAAEKGNLFVKGELGRELYARGEFSRAADEFKGLVAAAQGDNRVLAPALKDYGRALAKADRGKEALDVLRQALRASGSQAGVRTELYEVIAEVYRKEQRVPELLAELEKEGGSDSARLLLLGSLYEESGDTEKALATYKRALGQNPRNLDVRLKVVRLYQARGELDKAITEYEALVRAAPNNPTFVFELTEALLQRGERARALTVLSEVETRAHGDEDILGRIADYYGRLGESARAVRLLERLATSTGADPGHIVDLGDRHYQSGNVPLAVQTWKRLLTAVTPRAKALSALADVYLEHDMVQEALTLVQEAVSLDKTNVAYKKQLATALERAQRPTESEAVWNELLAKAAATQDVQLAREARSRVVSSWSIHRTLAEHVVPLRKRLEGKPPDLEAGRMLAEVEVRLRKPADAERTLRQVLAKAPGDVDSYLALERALVPQNKIAEAIVVLEKLVVVDPKRSRELYTRMAQYALSVYKDADAVRYATKAVELNPDDAEGYRKLGELHAKRQQNDKAIAAYRQAIAKNERLYPVYFLLAELLAAKGEAAEADRLLRKVIRSAPDDELVVRATHQAMQLAERSGTLQSLEEDLLPMALASPGRPVFRKLLVTIYGTLTATWQRQSREGTPAERAAATAQLDKTGKRALKVLLDALADKDPSGQRIAIDLLAHEGNRAAALPLLSFATSDASAGLRVRAMLACAASGETSLTPKLATLLEHRSQDPNLSGRVASAAVWTLAELGGPKAYPSLRKILAGTSPELRAIAAYALRADRDPKTRSELARLAATRGEAPQLRAFAILSADPQTAADRKKILDLAADPEPWVAHAALVRMARAPPRRRRSPRSCRPRGLTALRTPNGAPGRRGGRGLRAVGARSREGASHRPTRPSRVRRRELVYCSRRPPGRRAHRHRRPREERAGHRARHHRGPGQRGRKGPPRSRASTRRRPRHARPVRHQEGHRRRRQRHRPHRRQRRARGHRAPRHVHRRRTSAPARGARSHPVGLRAAHARQRHRHTRTRRRCVQTRRARSHRPRPREDRPGRSHQRRARRREGHRLPRAQRRGPRPRPTRRAGSTRPHDGRSRGPRPDRRLRARPRSGPARALRGRSAEGHRRRAGRAKHRARSPGACPGGALGRRQRPVTCGG